MWIRERSLDLHVQVIPEVCVCVCVYVCRVCVNLPSTWDQRVTPIYFSSKQIKAC